MENSDSSPPIHARAPSEGEVRAVFQNTLGHIHTALVVHYGLGETEAAELEKDLYVWFARFCMRPGTRSPAELRPLLLVACCQFARKYLSYVAVSMNRKGFRRKPSRNSDGKSRGRSLTGPGKSIVSSGKADGRLRLAVATQPALFRELLSLFLNKEPGVEVVGQACNEDEISLLLSQKKPNVLVFDYEALGPNGEATIARLRRADPGTRVLVLTTRSSEDTVERVLRAGGSGIVEKQLGSAALVRAIRAVAAGEVWANRHAIAQTLEHLADSNRVSASNGKLTKREWEIVDGVSQGFRNKEIARRLRISEKTVKSHVNSIFRKLQVDNRFAVGLYGWQLTRSRS
jgi:two-component system, NarL family, nitrate/nitrite response regulator NarL